MPLADTLSVFALTLVGVLTRPFRWNEAWFAAIGAAAMILLHRVTLTEAVSMTRGSGDVLLFLLFLMALSALTDASGFFDWAATHAVRAGKGSASRLLVLIFLLGMAITTALSLDTTALLLTPLVYAAVTKAKLPPKPYLFACAFVANIASSALPVSNLTNLLAFHQIGQSTRRYSAAMIAPTIAACGVTLGVLLVLYRGQLTEGYDSSAFTDPMESVPDVRYFRATLAILAVVLVGYFVGPQVFHVPLWMVAAAGSLSMLVAGKVTPRVRIRTLLSSGIAWSVFPFIVGMFVVVRGVQNLGLTALLGHVFAVGGRGLGGILDVAIVCAAGANIVNNIPMCLLALSALKSTSAGLLYAAILGVNLGPNITIVGSLATMLWRTSVQRQGVEITPGELARVGLAVTVPALLIACLCLWIALRL